MKLLIKKLSKGAMKRLETSGIATEEGQNIIIKTI